MSKLSDYDLRLLHDVEIEGAAPPKSKFRKVSVCYVILFFVVLCLCSFFAWFGYSQGVSMAKRAIEVLSPPIALPLPSRFRINESYIIPVWDQSRRGTCWCFAATYLLESQYKAFGVAHGYLEASEYVAFSQEALAKFMVDQCNQNPGVRLCAHSGRGKNRTSGGRVEDIVLWAKEFPETQRAVLPASACPYQPAPEDQMVCPAGYAESLANNPLEFRVKATRMTTGIESAKRLLVESGRPLSFSLAMPLQRYWFECSNGLVKDGDVCKYKLYPCQHDASLDCAPHDFALQKGSDSEMIFHPTSETVPGTGHAMVVVGYNDDFVPKRIVNFAGRPPMRGGFIVRNSWGAKGHSIEYLMNEISEDQESYICPNKDNVMTWIPATLKCAQENAGDVTNCSLDMAEVFGDEVKKGAFELVCVNETHCDTSKKYALLRSDDNARTPVVQFSATGVPIASVIEIDGTSVKAINITTLPFQHLYYAFQPTIVKKDHGERCGHVFLSYDAMETIMSLQSSSSPSWRVLDVEFEWLRKSYAKSGLSFNYSHVLNSTKRYSPLKVSHPFDLLDL